jgi:serine/threonine-protein kinase
MPEPTGEAAVRVEREAISLFDDLLDVPETSRARWIDERTADPAVKARLAELLEADRVASLRTGGAALGLSGAAPLPERIGRYRITALIGRGGMGAVYRGTRDSGDFAHEVAIKLIKPGLLSDVLAERFRAERQTLATLQHPNIARLLDGGETEAGAPYIVMELIEGQPIDRWADANSLDTAARVRLVETAVDAVAHAHGRLVVHRDITPLNVLVQDDGTVKLIDFGIARVVPEDGQPTASTTTATDIAGLGRLLKRLVPDPAPELAAIIARTQSAGDEATGSGAYPTAAALGADLAALRHGQPVTAMAGGEAYRLRKFVQRNRIAVGASALVALALVAGLAVSLWSLQQADAARREAEARFAETRGIANALLFEAFEAVSRVPGATRARETLAATATRYLDGLAAIPNAPADVRREAGLGYLRLARVKGGSSSASLGRNEEANALLAKASALLEPADGKLPTDAAGAEALADLWVEKAGVDLYNNMEIARARQLGERAEALTRPYARSSPALASLHARAIQVQGDSFGWDDDYPKALPQLERATTFLASLPPAQQASPEILAVRGPVLRLLAEAQHKLKQADAARATNEAAIAANRALVAADPADPSASRKLIISLWYAAVVHRTNMRDREARAAIDEALALARDRMQRDSSDLDAAKLLAIVLEVKTQTLADAGRRAETIAATDELMAIHTRLVKEGGNTPGALRSMTAAINTRGGDFYNLGDIPNACRMWRWAAANYEQLDKRGQLSVYDRENELAEARKLVDDVCVKGLKAQL